MPFEDDRDGKDFVAMWVEKFSWFLEFLFLKAVLHLKFKFSSQKLKFPLKIQNFPPKIQISRQKLKFSHSSRNYKRVAEAWLDDYKQVRKKFKKKEIKLIFIQF